MYKIPMYQPPTDLTISNIHRKSRLQDMYLCLRVTSSKDDPLSKHKVTPSTKHLYMIPEIHTLAPKLDDLGVYSESKLLGHRETQKHLMNQ